MTALETWKESLPASPAERLPKSLKLTVAGAPRTKKNSPVIVRNITDAFLNPLPMSEQGLWEWVTNRETILPHPRLLPSPAYRDWEAAAIKAVLPVLEPLRRFFPVNYSCHLLAKVYRDRDVGDWCGYMQGLSDFLEDIGVVEDDILIRSYDGSRLLKDPENPRVELWLTPWHQEADTGLFERPAREWAEHEEPAPEELSADEEQRGGTRTGLYSVYGGRRHG
jgi:hypothetical protein